MLKRCLIATVFIFGVGGCSHSQTTSEGSKTTQVTAASVPAVLQVHGHRGARGRFPENSLPAFNYALEIGADVLELDMGVTSDNQIVVSHDPFINPELCLDTQGKKIKEKIPIHGLKLEQVQAYRCGLIPQARFPKQKKMLVKIPTLQEVFDLVKASKASGASTVQFNIETKIVPGYPQISPTPEEFARLVVDLVRKNGLEERVMVQSFDSRTLVSVKVMDSRIRTSQLTSDDLTDPVAVVTSLGADILSPNLNWITKSDVELLHKRHVQVAPWTADEPQEWDRLVELGVDAIITDYPEELLAYLKTKGVRK